MGMDTEADCARLLPVPAAKRTAAAKEAFALLIVRIMEFLSVGL